MGDRVRNSKPEFETIINRVDIDNVVQILMYSQAHEFIVV